MRPKFALPHQPGAADLGDRGQDEEDDRAGDSHGARVNRVLTPSGLRYGGGVRHGRLAMNIPLFLGWTWTSINDGAAESNDARRADFNPSGVSTRVHRSSAPLGQRHRILPAATRVHLGAQHQQGIAGGVEPAGHGGEDSAAAWGRWIRTALTAARQSRRRRRGASRPRHRHEYRPRRGGHGQAHGPSQNVRHRRGARCLEAALDQWSRKQRGIDVRQLSLQCDQRSGLLAAHHEQRRPRYLGIDERPHRLAHPGRRVQADQHRTARGRPVTWL